MPIRKVSGGWSFGGGTHKTKAGAQRSYRAYLAKKGNQRGNTRTRRK
jgi:hypothetical protein